MVRTLPHRILLCFLVFAVGVAAPVAGQGDVAGVPPTLNYAQLIMGDGGFMLAGPDILEIEGVQKSERLSRSGAQLIRINRDVPAIAERFGGPATDSPFGGSGPTTFGTAEYFEVVPVEVDTGLGLEPAYGNPDVMYFVRPVPPEEIERRKVEAQGIDREAMADALDLYSLGALLVGAGLSNQIPGRDVRAGELEQAGVIAGACGGMARGEANARPGPYLEDSWVSPDPLFFMTGVACFTRAGAEIFRAADLTQEEKQAEITRMRDQAASRIQLQGEEMVDGRPTYALTMSNLGLSQTLEDGARIDFDRATVWIDSEYFVRRKTRLEGTMNAEGQSREFFMERLERDYRNVPDSELYEPYLTVLRMGGMMTPQQEREMQEALAQLEEYDRQMASVPAAQREMVERMMGDRMEQARRLATGGAVEFELITTSIEVNPSLGGGMFAMVGEDVLIGVVQRDLALLGYEPGPVTSRMNEETRAAIVQFQTDRGLEATGEATPELAVALKTALAAR
ncbi:MAG TPA: peptidoglycan-binding domain-containing protein [Longimicrobiales bacterium]|nr:peptidoglycan-binding domain-containing protein [Longimicrobiales bacterium]